MAWDDGLKTVARTKGSKPKTWEQTVDKAIANQIKIANGDKIPNQKKNGYLLSWRDDSGLVKVKLANSLVFAKDYQLDMDGYKDLLSRLSKWKETPDLKEAIDAVKAKRDANKK